MSFPRLICFWLLASFSPFPAYAQAIVNGDFNSSALRVALGYGASVNATHRDLGWVGSSLASRCLNVATNLTGVNWGNLRPAGGVADSGFLFVDDGSDNQSGNIWNLSTGGSNGVAGITFDIGVKTMANATVSIANATVSNPLTIAYAVYGFRGSAAQLAAQFPPLPVTTLNTLDDPGSVQGFTTLASGNLAAVSTLNSFQNQAVTFPVDKQGAYDFYLVGFSALATGAEGVAIDNVSITTYLLPPPPPYNLSSSAVNARAIQVHFTDNSTNEESFIVSYRRSGAADWSESMVSQNVTSSVLTNLEPESDYEVRVKARNAAGDSAWSSPAQSRTPALPPPPTSPTSLSLTAPNWYSLSANFTDSADNEEQFVLAYRKVGESVWTEEILDPVAGSGSVVAFDIKSLMPSTAYEFRIRAHNIGGDSAWSEVVFISTPAQPTRPNIIFILADDFGPDGLGSFGSELFATLTPRIDALANAGIKFPRTFCTGICSPSRAQFATGQYPFRNGCLDIDGSAYRTDPNRPSLARIMSDAGYRTGSTGKGIGAAGEEGDDSIDERLDAVGYWNVPSSAFNKSGNSTVNPADYPYAPDAFQAFALDFIERNKPSVANNHRPFYFQYGLINPHTPIERTPDTAPGVTDTTVFYRDNIAYIDKIVGQIVDKLEELGIARNTLILFAGDNGSLALYQSKLFDPKSQTYRTIHGGKADRVLYREGSALVPLIAYWPAGILEPRTDQSLIDFTDFLPTLAELVQGSIPANWTIDGRSFAGNLLRHPEWIPRRWIFSQLENNWYVRGDKYRLQRDGKLYDMTDAPFGMTEVPLSSESPEAASMRAEYQALLDTFDPVNGVTYEAHQDNEFANPAWSWKSAQFGSTGRWETPTSGDLSDPDQDGVPNILERAFGWNPKNGTDALPMGIATASLNGTALEAFLAGNFSVNGTEMLGNDTVVGIEASPNLVDWMPVPPRLSDGWFHFRAEPSPGVTKLFLRMRATRQTSWPEP